MVKPTHVGIDGDILLYQAASAVQARGYIAYDEEGNPIRYSKYKKNVMDYPSFKPYACVELEDIEHAKRIFDSKISTTIRKTGATKHTIYITGKGNFRKDLYEEYKANRGPKPLLYSVIRQHALDKINTVLVDGQEADDALAIAQTNDREGHIIASIDKDLLMVHGHHYNLNKGEMSYITQEEGMLNFYKQLLTGDKIDNIPGIKGVGDKTAGKLLADCKNEEEMWVVALNRWCKEAMGDGLSLVDTSIVYEEVVRNGRLLWMRTKEGEIWTPPTTLTPSHVSPRTVGES